MPEEKDALGEHIYNEFVSTKEKECDNFYLFFRKKFF